ncbi:hypothetical protein FS749_008283 [Ceratobasidium sp. UAMH 11750]|nr:hypothetical protein FS749_008283 [Ceratobasidium sp. UAMH 11750]
MPSAQAKVFETPELLSLVCENSQLKTCATLLHVNGSGFRAAVPFVWSSVNQVSDLLGLIPGVAGLNLITLPPFANADFTRFDLYAQHVRSLVVDCCLQITPWQTLVLQSKQRPLLPRLSCLIVERQDKKDVTAQGIMWSTIFLTESLTSVHIANIGVVSMLGISIFLDSVNRSGAHVQKLSLPPVVKGAEGTDGEHYLLSLVPNRPVPQTFLALSDLCALGVGLWIFRPESLQTLGTLPQLQLLEFTHDGSTTAPLEPVPSYENSFPALKQLCLRNVFWSHVGVVLRHRSLVKNLTSLEVIATDNWTETWEDVDATLLTVGDIPGLTDLAIGFEGYEDYPINPGEPFVYVLSQLPLRSLKLVRVQFIGLRLFELSQIFPVLTELRLPHQDVDPEDFLSFATIPKLRHLATTPWSFVMSDPVTSEAVPVCPSLHTLEFTGFWTLGSPTNDMRSFAKYFHRVFPNMKQLIWPKGNKKLVAHHEMTLLNACIGVLRERTDTRARIAEQYGWEVANCLLPDDDKLLRAIL